MTTVERTPDGNAGLTAKGRATRARIVDAAAELIFERGVASTSTEDIREAADVSNSQLYHYFTDKSDLVRAVVERQAERILVLQRPLLGRLDSFEALEEWRDALIDLQVERGCRGGCPIGSLASELSEIDENARTALVDRFAAWEEAIRDGLERMRDRGELRYGTDVDPLAVAALAALQGGLLLTQTRRDPAPLRAGLDSAIAYIRTFAA
jgi:TetR/AcrR family transcriptional regulator, transcriptional repressor for nem operon